MRGNTRTIKQGRFHEAFDFSRTSVSVDQWNDLTEAALFAQHCWQHGVMGERRSNLLQEQFQSLV